MAQQTAVEPKLAESRFADLDSRFAARLIDLAVLSLLYTPIYGLFYLAAMLWSLPSALLFAMPFLAIPFFIVYFAVLTARSGQTLGKRFMGIQAQDASGGLPPLRRCVWRATVDVTCMCLVMLVVGLLDYLWMRWQKDSRTLHDLAAGTVVRCIRPYPSSVRVTLVAFVALLVMQVSNVPHAFVTNRAPQDLDNMSPTIRKGEWWEANRLAYRHRSPSVGDVVAFHAFGTNGTVGRVVGMAGETLAFRDGQVQRVAPQPSRTILPDEVTVPQGSVALAGDNRSTPSSAVFQSSFPPFPPAPPPPPHPGSTQFVPTPSPWPQPRNSGPIITVPISDIDGQVFAVTMPYWHLRLVK